MMNWAQRIIFMTEETVGTLYLLGEQDRIASISGFTVRPPVARKEKPKVSAFTRTKIAKILDLKPDLVLGFSDLHVKAGHPHCIATGYGCPIFLIPWLSNL